MSDEFQKLESSDDAAQAEVDRWIRENKEQREKGGGLSDAELERRINERLAPIRKGYEDYLARHPNEARAHLAFGDFLNDRQDERGAQAQWERALQLDTNNPAIYNNLAGRYGESGPVNKAFEYFSKAIELSPKEPVYYHNFADVLFVLRKQAGSYYGVDEQNVYGRCLLMYSNALRLDPTNFPFARDFAQTYYSLKPLRTDEALNAWTNALKIAREERDRQDAVVHLARVKMLAGRFAEARAGLDTVTLPACMVAKNSLLKNLEQREAAASKNAGDQKQNDHTP